MLPSSEIPSSNVRVKFSAQVLQGCLLLALLGTAVPDAQGQVNFTTTFGTPSRIPTSPFNANYPYSVEVAGITAPVTKVRLTLHTLNCSNLGAVNVLLRDPFGEDWLVVMSGVRQASFNGNITFDQAAGSAIPTGTGSSVTPGSYRPTSTNGTVQYPLQEGQPLSFTGVDVAAPAGTGNLNKFIGNDPNGAWAVWMYNTAGDNAFINGITLEITADADLSIVKTHAAPMIKQGDTGVVYKIQVSNSGGSALPSQTVTVTDPMPTGLTATGLSGTGWNCTLTPSPSCTRTTNDGLPAQTSYPALDLVVNVASNAPTQITNTATVATAGDIISSNNSSGDTATIFREADLSITLTDNVSSIVAGTPVSYTLEVSNLGPRDLTGVNLGAFLNYLTAMTFTATQTGGASGFSASGSGFINNSNISLPNGSKVTYVINATLSPAAQGFPAGQFTQNVSVSGPFFLFDPVTSNNAASDTDTLIYQADLSIVKTGPSTVSPDTDVTWNISVTNNGPSDAHNVTLTDTLPIPFVSQQQTGTFNPFFNLSENGNAITDTVAYFQVGATVTFEFTGHVPPATPPGASIANTATVTSADDAATGNNSSTSTAVTPAPDLTITKTHSQVFKEGDAARNYTIRVTNSGTAITAGTVTVTDDLPAGLVKTNMTGPGWLCIDAPLSCSRESALDPGEDYPDITLTVSVNADAPPSVDNVATVGGGSEVNTSNNIATDTTVIVQAADLIISQSHSGGDVLLGAASTLTFTVTNSGDGPTAGIVTVTDVLTPAGLTPTAMGGTGWICDAGLLTCTTSNPLASAASYPAITLTFDVEPDAPAQVGSDAAVSGGGQVVTANDTSHFDVEVYAPWGPPVAFLATTQSATEVAAGWRRVSGATRYAIFRATNVSGPWTEIAQPPALLFLDSGLAANTTYLYKAQSIDASEQRSSFSAMDAATTTVFTDDPLGTGITIKAVHMIQLRTTVQAMRAAANLAPFSFTDPGLTAGTGVKAAHMQELRTALTAARTVFGLPNLFPDTIVPGMIILRSHVQQLRVGVK